MSERDNLRELITERLTAAAEDIFLLFKNTIVEYQDELERQRKLLESMNPGIHLHRIDVPQELVRKEEEVLSDQEKNSSPDQGEAEPPRIKEEPEEPCSIQEGEQLELKEETDWVMLTLNHEESDHSEPELHEHQLLSSNSHFTEDQDPTGSQHRHSEPSTTYIIPHSSHNTDMSENQFDPFQEQTSFKCDICGESFKNKTAIQTHQRFHSGKETHSCKICGKMFKWQSMLTAHLRCHTGERPYTCTTCGKGFFYISGLKKHNMIHTGEKPFTCTTCGKSFIQHQDLKAHIRTHTGERPFTCTTCGKTFTQHQDLKVHSRTHTGERPYSCNTCGKRFSHPKTLSDHNKTHTDDRPSSCNTCDKSFRNSSDLKKHVERVHLGKKPHSCSTCGKGFYSKAELTRHMQSHLSEN